MKATRFYQGIVLAAALAAASVASRAAEYTVPITGRKTLISHDWETEIRLGEQGLAKCIQENGICTDPAINARVQQIGRRIAAVTGYNLPWKFVVVNDLDADCVGLAFGGGKVAIKADYAARVDDAQLVAVIGHEIGHNVARHGAERGSWGSLHEGDALRLADRALERTTEYEADRMGLVYLAMAGYDPREAMAYRESGAWCDQRTDPDDTHPCFADRARHVRKYLPEALCYYYAARGRTPAGDEWEVPCPHCGTHLDVPLTASPGTKVKCGACQRVFAFSYVPEKWTAAKGGKTRCPGCRTELAVPWSTSPAMDIRCGACGQTFRCTYVAKRGTTQ